MAFASVNLFPSFIGNGSLTKRWSYTTSDSVATVTTSGYFNTAAGALGIGDIIDVAIVDALPASSRATLTEVVPVIVTSNSAGVVGTTAQFPGMVQSANATNIGAVAAPASGTVAVTITRNGRFFELAFTLTAARISVTDGDGAGSHGALKIFDFIAAGIAFLGCRQAYTAFAEGALLTGAAGDAAFEIGVGTTAIAAAADGTLGNGVNENVGQAVAVTLSEGTGTGSAVDGPKTTALTGTLDLNLNWSGSAATIDATSTIDVTGTITVVGVLLN
jgi:hypothetical protein